MPGGFRRGGRRQREEERGALREQIDDLKAEIEELERRLSAVEG